MSNFFTYADYDFHDRRRLQKSALSALFKEGES